MPSSSRVAHIFNDMQADYDDLHDLWYAWLFSRLHFLIVKYWLPTWDGTAAKVLDVGCGTGFQSFLYAVCGAEVTGIDIADALVEVAREKAQRFRLRWPLSLFPAHFDFVERYNRLITRLIQRHRAGSKVVPPRFEVADAVELPSGDGTFDHVNCCGSTLSFIDDHEKAVGEIARVLKPGGTFVIEVESRYNLDIFWSIVDCLCFGRLGYEMTLRESLEAAVVRPRSPITVEYPFGEVRNPTYMRIKLFPKRGIRRILRDQGLEVTRTCSVHSVTNLIPSTILDTNEPGRRLVALFSALAAVEETLPRNLPGCSLVLFGRKAP